MGAHQRLNANRPCTAYALREQRTRLIRPERRKAFASRLHVDDAALFACAQHTRHDVYHMQREVGVAAMRAALGDSMRHIGKPCAAEIALAKRMIPLLNGRRLDLPRRLAREIRSSRHLNLTAKPVRIRQVQRSLGAEKCHRLHPVLPHVPTRDERDDRALRKFERRVNSPTFGSAVTVRVGVAAEVKAATRFTGPSSCTRFDT